MNKLDLHTTRHHFVRSKVIRFVEDNWDCGEDVEIITGRSGRMQELVIEVLNEYKLPYRIGDYSGVNTGFIKAEM